MMQYLTIYEMNDVHQVTYCNKRDINPLRANPTKRPNTLKQFVGKLLKGLIHFMSLVLETPENETLSDVFRWYRMRSVVLNRLITSI